MEYPPAAIPPDDIAPPEIASAVDETNRKLESFTSERMTPEDRALLVERHPVLRERPDLTSILDILDAEDARAFTGEAKSPP